MANDDLENRILQCVCCRIAGIGGTRPDHADHIIDEDELRDYFQQYYNIKTNQAMIVIDAKIPIIQTICPECSLTLSHNDNIVLVCLINEDSSTSPVVGACTLDRDILPNDLQKVADRSDGVPTLMIRQGGLTILKAKIQELRSSKNERQIDENLIIIDTLGDDLGWD